MKRCSNCNLEYMDESNVCSVCGENLEEMHTQISAKTLRKKNTAFKVILILCLLYAVVGFILWILGMTDTNWSMMMPLCCEGCDGLWYSKYWEYYFWYTLPFGILTLPICLFISNIIDNLLVISIIYIFNFRSVIDVFTCIKLRQLYAKLIRVEE